MSSNEAKARIRRLSVLQSQALSDLCAGGDGLRYGATLKTLDALVRRGLLIGRRFGDGGHWYRVASPAVHIAWCEWCSETESA